MYITISCFIFTLRNLLNKDKSEITQNNFISILQLVFVFSVFHSKATTCFFIMTLWS